MNTTGITTNGGDSVSAASLSSSAKKQKFRLTKHRSESEAAAEDEDEEADVAGDRRRRHTHYDIKTKLNGDVGGGGRGLLLLSAAATASPSRRPLLHPMASSVDSAASSGSEGAAYYRPVATPKMPPDATCSSARPQYNSVTWLRQEKLDRGFSMDGSHLGSDDIKNLLGDSEMDLTLEAEAQKKAVNATAATRQRRSILRKSRSGRRKSGNGSGKGEHVVLDTAVTEGYDLKSDNLMAFTDILHTETRRELKVI